VLSILAWPKSARTVCKSPVPFKMWRAFVRRKDKPEQASKVTMRMPTLLLMNTFMDPFYRRSAIPESLASAGSTTF
jgi:hypothetical protein